MRGPIRRRRGRLIAAAGRPEPSPHGIRMPSRRTACGHCDADARPRAASRHRPRAAAPPPPLCGLRCARDDQISHSRHGTREAGAARTRRRRGEAWWERGAAPRGARARRDGSIIYHTGWRAPLSCSTACWTRPHRSWPPPRLPDGERDAASQGEHVEDAVPHLSRAAGCRDWTGRRPAARETHRRPPQMSPG